MRLRLTRCVALCLILVGCTDPAQADNPIFNTKLGLTSGIFPPYRPQDYLCELLELGGETHLIWTLYRDVEHPDLGLRLPYPTRRNERFQVSGDFIYKVSNLDQAPAYAELEWGQGVEDVRPHPVPTLYFPVIIHRLRVPPKTHLCDTLTDGDCIDVPESTIVDSTFWCEDMRTTK